MAPRKTPVILDTDIGGDIDDTWALGFLLRCPELDLKLVSTGTGDPVYRAKTACKFLQNVGRADVPVGIGLPTRIDAVNKTLATWVEDYDLKAYPGRLHRKGIRALIDAIMNSPLPITLISIGPLTNIREALELEPGIVCNCRFVGMQGSVFRGYDGNPAPHAEYNVVHDVPSAKEALSADWLSTTLTPVDTCGLVRLAGDRYRAVRDSGDPIASTIIENYRHWRWGGEDFKTRSSVLFDTVAVYLGFSEEYLKIEELAVSVTDDGFTKPDTRGKAMRLAIDWRDMAAFQDLLATRLTKPPGT